MSILKYFVLLALFLGFSGNCFGMYTPRRGELVRGAIPAGLALAAAAMPVVELIGSGTVEDPYVLATLIDLAAFVPTITSDGCIVRVTETAQVYIVTKNKDTGRTSVSTPKRKT